MSGFRIQTRYAKSLIELAIESNQLAEVNKDVCYIQAVIKSSRPLRRLLRSPVVNADIKNKIMDQIFGQQISKLTMAFIRLLVNKRRDEHLSGVINEFIAHYNRYMKITPVNFITAVPVDETVLEKLRELFITRSGVSDIELNTKVDESIVGGFIFHFDDRLYDASVRRQLEHANDSFLENLYFGRFSKI